MKPFVHAQSSAKIYGGKPVDYIDLHNFMDSSKSVMADNRHRALLHHAFGIFILEQVFGNTVKNSNGVEIPTRNIGEQHVLEDFGGKFIPTVQDYLQDLPYNKWLEGGVPPSYRLIQDGRKASVRTFKFVD